MKAAVLSDTHDLLRDGGKDHPGLSSPGDTLCNHKKYIRSRHQSQQHCRTNKSPKVHNYKSDSNYFQLKLMLIIKKN